MHHHPLQRAGAWICAITATFAIMCSGIVPTQQAIADDDMDALQQAVEDSAQRYNEATDKVEELQGKIKENSSKIDKLEKEIPEKQARSNEAVKDLYLMEQESASMIDLVLNADSFEDFIDALTYCNRVIKHDAAVVADAKQAKDDLEATQKQLKQDKEDADTEAANAQTALADAKQARKEAMARAAAEAERQLEARRQAELEKEAASTSGADSENPEKKVAPNKKKADEPDKEEAEEEEEEPVEESVSSDSVDWDEEKQAFVEKWAGRIDSYLSGSPLAGYGKNFAAAAWDYGVDPRWSPAISNVESSKGLHCFRSHNAWGWGSSGWSSWEEAIDAHVSGLARGYGSTLTYAAACKYCPPNSRNWYNGVLAGMKSI